MMTGTNKIKQNTVVLIPGRSQTQSVSEYYVGVADDKIVYPGIQQCISVTVHDGQKLIGAHVSPGAGKGLVKLHYQLMTGAGANKAMLVYIVGNFDKHFATASSAWKSKEDIVKDTRKYLGKNAPIYLIDTTATDKNFSWGIDIIAERVSSGIDYKFSQASKKNAPQSPIADPTERF